MKILDTLSKNQRIGVVGLLGVSLLGGGGLTLRIPRPDMVSDQMVYQDLRGAIIYQEGLVEYRLSEQDGWRSSQVDLVVRPNMELRTMADGRAIINLDDGSSVRIGENSSMKFESLNPQDIIIAQHQGVVFHRVEPLERDYRVILDGEEVRSLGTAFHTFDTEEEKGVAVFESSVEIDSNQEKQVIMEGNKWYFSHQAEEGKAEKILALSQKDIDENEFITWNKDIETESDASSDKKGYLDTSAFGSVDLGTDVSEQGIKVSFELKNTINTGQVQIEATQVETGEVQRVVLDNVANTGEHLFALRDGAKYVIQACVYNGFECVVTSGQVSVSALPPEKIAQPTPQPVKPTPVLKGPAPKPISEPIKKEEPKSEPAPKDTAPKEAQVGSGTVQIGTIVSFEGKMEVKWTLNGSAPQGFKIVYSTSNGSPTYGKDDAAYTSDPKATNAYISNLGAGTYYVRVCRYTGSGCEGYSDVRTVEISNASKKN